MEGSRLRRRVAAVRLWAGRLAVIACLAAGGGTAAAQAIALAPQAEGATEDVDVRTPAFTPVEADGVAWWQHAFDGWPGSRFLRIHIASIKIPEGSTARLVLSDRAGRIVESLDGARLKAAGGSWTKIVTGDYALLSLIAEAPPVGLEVVVDKVGFSTSEGVALSTIGESELQEIDEYARDPLVSVLSRAVAKLSFIKNGRSYTCTGFMYGPDLMMTNEHCVNTPAICRDTVVIFQYQLENGQLSQGAQFRCAALVDMSPELDFAVLRVEGSPGLQWGTLNLSRDGVARDEPLMVVQHPGGRPKMISRLQCAATEPVVEGLAAESDFAHTCDTARGSSGSPMMTTTGQVVGLHHFGVAEGPFWNQNRAVRMAKILDRIQPQ